MKTLTTKATDNHGHSYTVTLTEVTHGRFTKKDWVLRLEGAGGGWAMTTLEERPSNRLDIDMGSEWYCNNFDAVLAEARTLLANTARLTVAEVKADEDNLWAALVTKV